jgi:endoglucanase
MNEKDILISLTMIGRRIITKAILTSLFVLSLMDCKSISVADSPGKLARKDFQRVNSLADTSIYGARVSGNRKEKNIALVFTGDEYFEGLPTITQTLKKHNVKAGFFFTGRLYANKEAKSDIRQLIENKHYLGPHSDQHLLYADWKNRDSLLVTRDSLINDLRNNCKKMDAFGISHRIKLYIPPFEWWNQQVAKWCLEEGFQLLSFTPGIPTNADYTYPEMQRSYRSNADILKRFFQKEKNEGIHGAIILIHVGTDPRRKEKLYDELSTIITSLRAKCYEFKRIDDLLK